VILSRTSIIKEIENGNLKFDLEQVTESEQYEGEFHQQVQ
jgi:hypothetical protein